MNEREYNYNRIKSKKKTKSPEIKEIDNKSNAFFNFENIKWIIIILTHAVPVVISIISRFYERHPFITGTFAISDLLLILVFIHNYLAKVRINEIFIKFDILLAREENNSNKYISFLEDYYKENNSKNTSNKKY